MGVGLTPPANPGSADVGRGALRAALRSSRGAFLGVGAFSAVVNALMLTGPLFMLQVYDRVLTSHSSATLAVLFAIVAFLYALMGVLDYCRGRVLARIGAGFQAKLDGPAFEAVLTEAEHPAQRDRPAGALRNLAAIRSALASPGMGALFDLPWTPLFILVMFAFHPWLGWFSLAGGVLVVALALLKQAATRKPQAAAGRLAAEADARTEAARKAAETVRALGMTPAMTGVWRKARAAALEAAMAASDAGGAPSAAAKAVRLLLQSAILGLGALLVLRGEITAGVMIAASILLGRALAPIEQVIGHWAQFQRAATSWKSLSKTLAARPPEREVLELPRPAARLSVRDLVVVPPGGTAPTLRGVTFSGEAGDAIAVIGPSACGKSTLARALAGFWPIAGGEIRLGGADLRQYDRDRLGTYIGYLPQDVALFSGTVAQNISRFDAADASEEIIACARRAGVHDLILGLSEGYDTRVSEGGGSLTGGERRRIGLARAFYGDPVLLVLDEPNANLDDAGMQALNRAVVAAREAGKIALVISHRPSALTECNKVLILEEGGMRIFGPRREVMERAGRPAKGAAGGPGMRGR